MDPISKTTIYRVLNNKGNQKEAEEVADWLATKEGQVWLSSALTKDAEFIENGIFSHDENIPVEDMLRKILAKIDRKRKRRIALTATAAFIPCMILIALWININNRLGGALSADFANERLTADRGEKKEVVFQDGSQVKLNSGSTIIYPHRFGISERRIQLEGEAFFDIESNNLRPFIVEMHNGTMIKVMGTQFNVSAYSDSKDIKVTLINGQIEFSDQSQAIQMKPNDFLRYDKDTGEITVKSLKDVNKNAMWIEDVILFRDTPLIDVLATLERQYDIEFTITDDNLKEYTYSLKINTKTSLDSILKDIESISSVRFTRTDNKIFVCNK